MPIADAAELGTPFGMLLNELRHAPRVLIQNMLSILQSAIGMDAGEVGSATACAFLYVLRTAACFRSRRALVPGPVRAPRLRPADRTVCPVFRGGGAPLTGKRHILPHSAQPQHTNYWAPRTRKRHPQEHRPQRPTERSDPTQRAKGRTGGRPGPRKGATTRRNVTQGALLSAEFGEGVRCRQRGNRR